MQCILSFALTPHPPSRILADPIELLLRAEPGTHGRKGRNEKKKKSKKQTLSSAICIVVRARCRRGPPAAGCRPQDEQGRSRSAAGNYMAVSPWLSQLWWRPPPPPKPSPRHITARHTLVAGKEGDCCRCLGPPLAPPPQPRLFFLLATAGISLGQELACGAFKSGGCKRPDSGYTMHVNGMVAPCGGLSTIAYGLELRKPV